MLRTLALASGLMAVALAPVFAQDAAAINPSRAVGLTPDKIQWQKGEASDQAWPIGNKWSAFGRMVYSLRDRSTLERFAGLEYKACCYRLRAVVRRFISSSDGTQETGFQLQLELKGLASVGTDADAFLGRSIRGYSPASSRR